MCALRQMTSNIYRLGTCRQRLGKILGLNPVLSSTTRWSSLSSGKEGFEDLDKPIKFTTSKAAEWKATSTHGGGTADDEMPWIQPYVVSLSVSIFLLYFLALREENDVDARMKTPLWELVPGLEKQQLEVILQYNTQHGLPTQDIEDRIKKLATISNSK